MNASEIQIKSKEGEGGGEGKHLGREQKKQKPPFRPAKDDTKPILRDPILRSDPIETEEAVLRLPPFPFVGANPKFNMNQTRDAALISLAQAKVKYAIPSVKVNVELQTITGYG